MKLDIQANRHNVRRINKLKVLLAAHLLLSVVSFGQINNKSVTRNQSVRPFSTKNKTVTIYMTADSSDLRLTLTTTARFRELRQPLESQISVFVDPAKTFQSFLGIGAVISHASPAGYPKL